MLQLDTYVFATS